MTAALDLEAVRKDFVVRDNGRSARFTAVQDLDLSVPDGQFLAVVGPSGCGKSTLLDLVAGLTTPTSGRILLHGEPVTGPATDRAVVFQQYALLPWRTARKNVELGLESVGVPRKQRARLADEHLDLVGLTGFADRYPHELSGGMKQRVAIARALAVDPRVLLMDEPFAALDAQTRESLQDELLRIWRATGKTVVFITHGIDEAVYLGQRVAVMSPRPGRISDLIDIDLDPVPGEDVRSDPAFGRLRHRVWSSLQQIEDRSETEVAHV
ncbi:ABC transporter ATP-binding protein [Cellulomonas sp. Leaf334]|uniref:ABC transporter ATP-binding protein n=1 Tax=Cellulomonas sp. Leaf334 TaxID=1736339 RepID=UPI0006F72AAE|nr:ABC transporter ATP-binding protein [Cellulomonas sp. Leaf334]KQR17422.1 ABC transporter ATP-binding protein [Cellulomonas sp. Leaf334]